MRLLFEGTKVIGIETIPSPKPKKGGDICFGEWLIKFLESMKFLDFG